MEWLAITGIVLGALVFTSLSGLVLRRVIRRMAERGVEGRQSRWWRAAVRYGGIDRTEMGAMRRRQRVDAAARMVNHIVTVVVWICVTIAIFQILDIDAAFFISSAGFIGAGLAIGGQHKVNDYLTGLEVLFEDRYGVGDELVVERLGADPLHAVVDHIGLFSTRLRDATSTLHVPNGGLVIVRNLSQQAQSDTLRLRVGDDPDFDLVSARSVTQTVRDLAGTENLTDVIFVGDLAAQRRDDGDIDVEVKTTRPLDGRSRELLRTKAEDTLRGRR
jgi:moderate conductance mechanosensitive channel